MLAVTRNIWSGLWFFSFPSSINQPFYFNMWCSHRKGINKLRIQPLHTVNSHVVIVIISSCVREKAHGLQTWHLMVLPPLKAFSSWEAHKQTHLKSSSWPWLEEETVFWKLTRVNRDSSVYLLDSFRLCVPHSSGSGSPAMQKIYWLLISLALNKATEERLHAYGDRLPHPISLVHIAISWVLPLRVSTCHYKCMYTCLGFVRYDHGLILHGLYFSIAKRLENDFIWPKIQCPWKWYLETLTFSSLY